MPETGGAAGPPRGAMQREDPFFEEHGWIKVESKKSKSMARREAGQQRAAAVHLPLYCGQQRATQQLPYAARAPTRTQATPCTQPVLLQALQARHGRPRAAQPLTRQPSSFGEFLAASLDLEIPFRPPFRHAAGRPRSNGVASGAPLTTKTLQRSNASNNGIFVHDAPHPQASGAYHSCQGGGGPYKQQQQQQTFNNSNCPSRHYANGHGGSHQYPAKQGSNNHLNGFGHRNQFGGFSQQHAKQSNGHVDRLQQQQQPPYQHKGFDKGFQQKRFHHKNQQESEFPQERVYNNQQQPGFQRKGFHQNQQASGFQQTFNNGSINPRQHHVPQQQNAAVRGGLVALPGPVTAPPRRPAALPVPSAEQRARLVALLQAKKYKQHDAPQLLSEAAGVVAALQPHPTKHRDCLRDFVTQVCTSKFVQRLDAVLDASLLLRLNAATPAFFGDVERLLGAMYAHARPAALQRNLEDVVGHALQAIEDTKTSAPTTRRNLRDLYGKLVQTTYWSDGDPPNSFRDLPLVPTAADLQQRQVFLQPNQVEGPYPGVEQYLCTQFRLLREDFLKPLRDSIAEIRGLAHLGRGSEQRWNAVRMYRHVSFAKVRSQDRGRAPDSLLMRFDPERSLNIDWRMSKRFMMGCMLVISNDNFDTVHLAKVHRRDYDLLCRGELPVQVFGSETSKLTLERGEFTVGECTVFFEPYFQVMRVLQNTPADAFPLQRYIVGVDKGHELPDYLLEPARRVYEVRQVPPLGPLLLDVVSGPWPSAEALGLNASQGRALRGALTRKVMLVQGPPGTGKTFLGLRVVATLLGNPGAWSAGGQIPILVVCYTNHALDQFLAGLIEASGHSLVRLGGRCQDDRLQPYVLDMRGSIEESSAASRREFGSLKRQEDEARRAVLAVQDAALALFQRRGVLSAQTLLGWGVVPREPLRRALAQHGDSVAAWLEGGLWSTLTPEEARLLRPRPQSNADSRQLVVFEETFEQIEVTREELTSLVRNGHTQHARAQRHCKERLEYFREQTAKWRRVADKELSHQAEAAQPQPGSGDGPQGGVARNGTESPAAGEKAGDSPSSDAEEEGEQDPDEGDLEETEEEQCEDDEGSEDDEESESEEEDPEEDEDSRGLGEEADEDSEELQEEIAPPNENPEDVLDLANLEFNERWKVYERWLRHIQARLREEERGWERELRRRADAVEEFRMEQCAERIRGKLVVGMTTTKAAAMHKLLHILKPSIVVVEEAAEVLESHVIAALHPGVQHLFLLGDHKQLRPSPSVHELAVHYKLDVSMFERLCDNGLSCETLNVQHRMRPEIAALIQHIYPGLEDHASVRSYPAVRGVASNLFFVDHACPEKSMEELMSHSNEFEAHFLGALVQYLVRQQAYREDQITVLTTYAGQLMEMRGLVHTYPCLHNVRICNVDNFQGEECDVILLSLVRSNPTHNIGFLNIPNRVCVALSRAKHGLYIVGNMTCLAGRSAVWQNVRAALVASNALGGALPLRCDREGHTSARRLVATAEDFGLKGKGLCDRRCDYVMECGHQCPKLCHPYQEGSHCGGTCTEQCLRPCARLLHRCPRRCYEPCPEWCEWQEDWPLACGHWASMECRKDPATYECRKSKMVELPGCGHEAKMACYQDPAKILCKKRVRRVLAVCGHENVVDCFADGPCKMSCDFVRPGCGHKCGRKCHRASDPNHVQTKCREPCPRPRPQCSAGDSAQHACPARCGEPCPPCDVPVSKALPSCRHSTRLPCAMTTQDVACTAPCERVLSTCGHRCKRRCGEECGGCVVEVPKTHPECGHDVEVACSADPASVACMKQCERTLPCGHKCSKLCWQPCLPCKDEAPMPRSVCPHVVQTLCGQDPDEVECKAHCEEKLPGCGHRCSQKCGAPCDTRCDRRVKHPTKPPCGHAVKVACHEATGGLLSEDKLQSRCDGPCGAKLRPCLHPCKGNCQDCHQGRLHRACQEDCNRELLCGHKCPGKCGRPCLPCKEHCPVKCSHRVICREPCGRPCTPCHDKCELGKPRVKCTKKCREPCSFLLSDEACRFPTKAKSCANMNHNCVGFHGEPCPPLCGVCDKDALGNPMVQERFVLLPDCGHTVREAAMAKAFEDQPTVLGMPACPRCKVPATNCARYANAMRERLRGVVEAYKEMAFSDELKRSLGRAVDVLSGKLEGYAPRIDVRQKKQNDFIKSASPDLWELMGALRSDMRLHQQQHQDAAGRRVAWTDEDAAAARSLGSCGALACALDDCVRSLLPSGTVGKQGAAGLSLAAEARREVVGRVNALAAAVGAETRDWRALSEQEVHSVNAELKRIQRLQQLCMIEAAVGGPKALQALEELPEEEKSPDEESPEEESQHGEEEGAQESPEEAPEPGVGDYAQVSKLLRSCQPYPLIAMDHGVLRALRRMSARAGCEDPVERVDWARNDVPLPMSAARGAWFVCDLCGHAYRRAAKGERCGRCATRRQPQGGDMPHAGGASHARSDGTALP